MRTPHPFNVGAKYESGNENKDYTIKKEDFDSIMKEYRNLAESSKKLGELLSKINIKK